MDATRGADGALLREGDALVKTRSWIAPAALVGVVVAVGTGCGGFFMPADTLRPQAAFDLQCPEAQIQMQELSGDCGKKLGTTYDCTLGVRGCGKQTTYSHIRGSNTWAANAPH